MKKQNLVTPQHRSMFESGYRVMQGEQEFVTYRDDTTIRVWYAMEPDHYSEHTHSSVEVILPNQGECRCVVNGVEHIVHADEVMFVPPNVPHSLSMGEGSVRNLVLFDMDYLMGLRGFSAIRPMVQGIIHLRSDSPLCGQIRALFSEMMEKYYAFPPLLNLICYGYILQIYVLLGQEYLAQHVPEEENQQKREENSWAAINRVVEYINKNYADPITLDSIASIAGFSKYYFSRLFTKYTGTSFSQYLLRKRITVAAHLLCNTSLPIVQVSLQSGFSSLSTFNRTFKDVHGCTPTEYRAIYEKDAESSK